MITERVERLRANVDAWWDLVRVAGHKAEILKPLATSGALRAKLDEGVGAGSHYLLVHTLLFDLIKDIVALTSDAGDKAPSLVNIQSMIEDPQVQSELRADASASRVNYVDVLGTDVPPDLVQSIADDLAASDRARDEADFDNHIQAILPAIDALLGRDVVVKLKTARDKAIAHYELEMRNGGRQLFEIGGIGLKWGDAEAVLSGLEEIGYMLNLAVRGSYYEPGERRRLDRESAEDFWGRLTNINLSNDRQSERDA